MLEGFSPSSNVLRFAFARSTGAVPPLFSTFELAPSSVYTMLALARFDTVLDHSTMPTVGICELMALTMSENEQLAAPLVPPVEDEAPPVAREPPDTVVLAEDDITPPVWSTPPEAVPPPVVFELPLLPPVDVLDVEFGETLHARANRAMAELRFVQMKACINDKFSKAYPSG